MLLKSEGARVEAAERTQCETAFVTRARPRPRPRDRTRRADRRNGNPERAIHAGVYRLNEKLTARAVSLLSRSASARGALADTGRHALTTKQRPPLRGA